MRNQYFSNVQDEDLRFLAENYLISSTSGTGAPQRAVDYRKFLSDLKLHGEGPTKSLASLTREQQQIFNELKANLRK